MSRPLRSRAASGALVLVAAAGGVAGCSGESLQNVLQQATSQSPSPTPDKSGSPSVHPAELPKVPAAPHYDALKVADQAYVNACRAYSGDKGKVISAFDQYTPTNAVVQVTYAENPLPASWYTTPDDLATSSCSVELFDPPWDDATVIFGIDQYGSSELAKAAFTAYKPQSQAELDKINAKWGTHLQVSPNNTKTLPGLADTYYAPRAGVTYTLVGNKIVTFNGGTPWVSEGTYLAALRKAIPRAVAVVRQPGLQAEKGSQDWGKHIGSSIYRNPCTIFTSDVFTKATGLTADPTSVSLTYNASAVSHPHAVETDGVADNSCDRHSLSLANPRVGGHLYADVEVKIGYFTTPAQVQQQLRIRRAKDASRIKTVTGMGPGAFTYTYSNITSLTVAHGPYTLTISGRLTNDGKPTGDNLELLKAAAAATIPHL